jgi:type IV secretory pathway ATPase VirB11/archaellum biosynthesis ATPase
MADPLPATVEAPVPPGAPEAWYAPTVRDQYRIGTDVVATVREGADGFAYETRTPPQSTAARAASRRVTHYLEDVDIERPRTREGTVERMAAGLSKPYRQVVDRLTETTPAQDRRLAYHLTAAVEGLGELTALALDEKIRIADASGPDGIEVHTEDFAPASTQVPGDAPYLDRFLSERLAHYTVDAFDHDVPVTIYRERVLGSDVFETKYHVHAPARLPGDEALVAAVEDRIVDESVGGRVADRTAHVRDRARRLLARRLLTRSARSSIGDLGRTVRRAFATVGLATAPLEPGADDRIDDLVYVVLRDLIGEGQFTVPIRDPHLERVEANRVGERVKVVPRPDVCEGDGRMPTTITVDDERRFVTLATRLAAAGGVELGPRRPHATVSIAPTDAGPISCSLALPSASTDGPFLSIDKRGQHPATPVDVLDAGVLDPDLVALLWLAIEHRQAIAFVGPDQARPGTLVEAHAPFVPFGDRPVVVSPGTRSITLPHETGISLTNDALARTADDRTSLDRAADLGPDVTVMTDLAGEPAYRHLGDALASGRGVLVSAAAADFSAFTNRAVENGLSLRTVQSVDLVVVLDVVAGTPRVVALEMPVDEHDDAGRVVVDGPRETVRARDLLADGESAFDPYLASLAGGDEELSAVAAEHERLTRYVRYLQTADVRETDDLFAFLADLRTDEAATVERIHRVLAE